MVIPALLFVAQLKSKCMLKMHILTMVLGAQLPNAGRNMQQVGKGYASVWIQGFPETSFITQPPLS